MRIFGALVVAAGIAAAACGGDSGNGGASSNTTPPPSSCATPCTPGGQVCIGRGDGNCNGTWYCWADATWHCAPPDASAPGEGGYDAAEIEASLAGEGTGDAAASDGAGE